MSEPLRPLICAHRGASDKLADNSIPAFDAAIAAGADVIETDLRAGPGGQLVLAHDPLTGGEDRVSLDALLELARGRIGLDLELKETGLTEPLLAAIRGWSDWLLITSFQPAVLAELRRQAPDLRTGLLVEAPVTVHPGLAARECGASVVLWEDALATPTALQACARVGLGAWTWTVNAPFALAERLAEPGLQGVITDVPALAVALAGGVAECEEGARA